MTTTRSGGSTCYDPAHRNEVYAGLLDFFATNLGNRPGPTRQRPRSNANGEVSGGVLQCFANAFLLPCWSPGSRRRSAEPRLPLDYFTRHDDFVDIRISPDGDYFASSLLVKDEGVIAIYRIQPFEIVGGLRSQEGTLIGELHWSSPTRLLYSVAQRQVGLATPVSTGEIFAVDRDGGTQAALYGYRAAGMQRSRADDPRLPQAESSYGSADIVDELDDDDRHVLICEQPWKRTGWSMRYSPDMAPTLSMLDTYSAKKTVIERLPLGDASPLLNDKHEARFAAGYDKEGHIGVIWKPDKEWISFALPGFRERTVVPAALHARPASRLFTGEKEDESLNALYRLDLESQRSEKIYQDDEADIDAVVTDLADKAVIGVRVYTYKPEYHWLEPNDPTAKLYETMQRAFPGQAVTITSVTPISAVRSRSCTRTSARATTI